MFLKIPQKEKKYFKAVNKRSLFALCLFFCYSSMPINRVMRDKHENKQEKHLYLMDIKHRLIYIQKYTSLSQS